jgi:plasmid maintenance system antidote protein VapI
MWHRYFSQVLLNSFSAAVRAEPKLSLRGYAKRLDVSPSVLSEIFRDQRKISKERALQIAQMANMEPAVLQQLEKLMALKTDTTPRRVLSGDAVDLVMNPDYYRLLCALEVLPTPTTVEDISAFLSVDRGTLVAAVEKLQSFGILFLEGPQIYWGGLHLTTTDDIPSEKIREFHRNALKQATDDLALPVTEREYTSVIFAGSHARLSEAKSHIRTFRDTLSDSMRDSRPDSVYQLTIQLRPVSRVLSKRS